jgi:hypothetical protein
MSASSRSETQETLMQELRNAATSSLAFDGIWLRRLESASRSDGVSCCLKLPSNRTLRRVFSFNNLVTGLDVLSPVWVIWPT